jgi:hypothetical protein
VGDVNCFVWGTDSFVSGLMTDWFMNIAQERVTKTFMKKERFCHSLGLLCYL